MQAIADDVPVHGPKALWCTWCCKCIGCVSAECLCVCVRSKVAQAWKQLFWLRSAQDVHDAPPRYGVICATDGRAVPGMV